MYVLGTGTLAKRRRRIFAWTLVAWWSVALSQSGLSEEDREFHRLIRLKVTRADEQRIEKLVTKGFDIAGRNIENGTLDVIVHSQKEAQELASWQDLFVQARDLDALQMPDVGYKAPQDINDILSGFAAKYPNLLKVYSIGKSVEGRDIWAVKITHGPEQDDARKPAILFNALHHAREVMTTEVALDTIEQLVTLYDKDPEVTHWVDDNVLWIVPMVNPDGSQKVWSRNTMWRKNTRNGHGVDINRNYPYAWNSCNGSSGTTGSETYRGPSPGSEPETQALMSLVKQIQPVFNISYHSYSEMVLYPYGCRGRRAEAAEIVEPIGQAMAKALPSDTGRGTYRAGTSWELLYSVDGSDMDWMYHDQHVLAYVIEVNTDREGFQPDYTWRGPTVEKLRAAWKLLLQRLDQSGIHGLVQRQDGSGVSDLPVTIQRMEGPSLVTLVEARTKRDGQFHVILNPGHYLVTFGTGDGQVSRDVMIGETRVDFDVTI